ncbi:hypothetical protein B0T17DRAFT_48705 [Bombardia bombarda]|uniref:Integral membrane protein n=1 Tax=Bombardia bombarda TaxID=252184 RepID=A0AA39XKC0_9PEZI|nr:hypothetical protein B0T17DRAFT_48705 [Bombardia bombarda]
MDDSNVKSNSGQLHHHFSHYNFHHNAVHSTGPFACLNPTTRYSLLPSPSTSTGSLSSTPSPPPPDAASSPPPPTPHHHHAAVYNVWRSRDNRKGRHSVLVHPSAILHKTASAIADRNGGGDQHGGGGITHPPPTDTLAGARRGIVKMATRYPLWDISYDVAVVFTLGSVVWVINGCFVWLPLAAPWTEFTGEVETGGGVTAFLGATIFEFGSVLLMLEAVNENRSDCFGWALEEAVRGRHLHSTDENCCRHHHRLRHTLLPSISSSSGSTGTNSTPREKRRWSWWPTTHELTSHYLRDVGFLACLSQMIGATIFWIAGFTGLPPIYDALPTTSVTNGIYWLPQVVGGTGFIVSSILFMIEVQERWYLPAPWMLGWHIGLWNLVGAIGFTLCGALGFGVGGQNGDAVEYAVTLSTFVGSWAFLIGSIIQWFESLDKYTILVGTARLPLSLLSSSSSKGTGVEKV